MRAHRISAYVFAVAASLAGCTGTGDVRYAGEVRVTSPELIVLEPGVQVVADADEPLFFADGFYWLYRDGYWLRSSNYQRGFVRVELSYVPERVRGIERPQTYVQYRRHMGRTHHARAGERVNRTPTAPRGTYDHRRHHDAQPAIPTQPTPVEPPRAPQAYPPPHQGVPSTPGAETWQPGRPHHPARPEGGVNPSPTQPQVTPPITSPRDVQGTPTPPHQVPPGHARSNGSGGVTPPSAGQTDRGAQARPNDNARRSAPTRDTSTEQGTASDRDDRATPPSSTPHVHAADKADDKHNNKNENENENVNVNVRKIENKHESKTENKKNR